MQVPFQYWFFARNSNAMLLHILFLYQYRSARTWIGNYYRMMTSSNGNIFRLTGNLCGEFTGHRWVPHTKARDAEPWCFLWSAPEKRLSKQSWGWWFETPLHPVTRKMFPFNDVIMHFLNAKYLVTWVPGDLFPGISGNEVGVTVIV